jgi:hypothetical protein
VRIIGVGTEWFTNDIKAKFISAIQTAGEIQSEIYIISVTQVVSTRRTPSQEIDVQFIAFFPNDSSAKSFSLLLTKSVLDMQFSLAGFLSIIIISPPSVLGSTPPPDEM